MIWVCAAVSSALGVVYATCSLYSRMSLPAAQFDENYSPEHTRFMRQNHRAVTRQHARPGRPYVRPQADDVMDVVLGYLHRNYIILKVWDGEKMIKQMTGVGIFNHYALLPRHYMKYISQQHDKGLKITCGPSYTENNGINHQQIEYTFDIKDFQSSEFTDLAIFKMPASFPMFKDIRKFMQTDADVNRGHLPSTGTLFLAPGRINKFVKCVDVDIHGYKTSEIIECYDGERFEAYDLVQYGFSHTGACGSVLLIPNSQRPIVAMHCAGSDQSGVHGDGFGVILSQEALGELMTLPVAAQLEDEPLESLEYATMIFDEGCAVEYLGTIPKNMLPAIPKKTKIVKSLVHNTEHLYACTEPTILSSQDKRYVELGFKNSPLYYGAAKHGQKTKDFPSTLIQKAETALWDGWISSMRPTITDPKRLSFEEAVVGIPGFEYYDPMKLTTSSGWPWTCGGATTKERWIEAKRNESDQIVACNIDPQLLTTLKFKEEQRRKGIVPSTKFVDTLKDERKKPQKIRKKGGTRVFCASPVDYTIALRQNLLHFCASFMKSRMNVMSAVGMNAKGTEWSALVRKLVSISANNLITLDYSNFGPAFNAKIAEAAKHIMIKWCLVYCKDMNETELDVLITEGIQSVHLCGNTVYRQSCGSPSGSPITVIINSLVNLLYILCAWHAMLTEAKQMIRTAFVSGDWSKFDSMYSVDHGEAAKAVDGIVDLWAEFREQTVHIVYGDDLIASVSDKWKWLWNTLTIQAFFARYKIVSTGAAKDDSAKALVRLDEATFLKRGFKKHPTRAYEWMGPLEWISVNDITQWVWSNPNMKVATEQNCEAAMLEAHGWGPEKYNMFRNDVNDALRKRKCQPVTLDWDDLDDKYYSDSLPSVGLSW